MGSGRYLPIQSFISYSINAWNHRVNGYRLFILHVEWSLYERVTRCRLLIQTNCNVATCLAGEWLYKRVSGIELLYKRTAVIEGQGYLSGCVCVCVCVSVACVKCPTTRLLPTQLICLPPHQRLVLVGSLQTQDPVLATFLSRPVASVLWRCSPRSSSLKPDHVPTRFCSNHSSCSPNPSAVFPLCSLPAQPIHHFPSVQEIVIFRQVLITSVDNSWRHRPQLATSPLEVIRSARSVILARLWADARSVSPSNVNMAPDASLRRLFLTEFSPQRSPDSPSRR